MRQGGNAATPRAQPLLPAAGRSRRSAPGWVAMAGARRDAASADAACSVGSPPARRVGARLFRKPPLLPPLFLLLPRRCPPGRRRAPCPPRLLLSVSSPARRDGGRPVPRRLAGAEGFPSPPRSSKRQGAVPLPWPCGGLGLPRLSCPPRPAGGAASTGMAAAAGRGPAVSPSPGGFKAAFKCPLPTGLLQRLSVRRPFPSGFPPERFPGGR